MFVCEARRGEASSDGKSTYTDWTGLSEWRWRSRYRLTVSVDRPVPGRQPVTETLARDLSVRPSVLPRSIAPWPLFGRNTNGRLRSTRIDWLLPSGECIVVTYAPRRRALSPPCPVVSPHVRPAGRPGDRASLGRTRDPPSTIDATERRWLDTISGGARQTNVRRSLHVRLSTPSGTQAGLGGRKDERATDWLIERALNRAPDFVADRPLSSSWSSLADWVTEQVRVVSKEVTQFIHGVTLKNPTTLRSLAQTDRLQQTPKARVIIP